MAAVKIQAVCAADERVTVEVYEHIDRQQIVDDAKTRTLKNKEAYEVDVSDNGGLRVTSMPAEQE